MTEMIPLYLTEDEGNTSSMARQEVYRDLKDPLDCYDDLELDRLTSKLFINPMERSVVYWHMTLGLFTIQEFGRFQVLGCMLKKPSQWGSIY